MVYMQYEFNGQKGKKIYSFATKSIKEAPPWSPAGRLIRNKIGCFNAISLVLYRSSQI